MQLLYFAWIRERTGVAEEQMALPDGVADVGGLVEHLKARGGGYQEALSDLSVVRVAVNQEYVGLDHPGRGRGRGCLLSAGDRRLTA